MAKKSKIEKENKRLKKLLKKIEGKKGKKEKKQPKSKAEKALLDRISSLESLLKDSNRGDTAIEVMIEERLDKANKMKGWKQFFNGKDDFGQKRSETISTMPAKKQLKALNKLIKKYKSANPSIGEGQGKPEKKLKKAKKNFDKRYAELEAKATAGKISAAEYNAEMDDIILDEMSYLAKLEDDT